MAISDIDPTKPADGVPAVKADFRANLAAIKGALTELAAGIPPGGFADTTPYGASRVGEVPRSLIQRLDPTRWINVKDFGALGDDSANDTAAVNAAVAYVNSVNSAPVGQAYVSAGPARTLYFPPGHYRADAVNPLEPGINVIMDGVLKYRLTAYTGTFWQIGNDTANNHQVELKLKLGGYGGGPPNPYTDESFVGVQIFNLNNSRVFVSSDAFTIGVQFISRSATSLMLHMNACDVFLGKCNGKVGLDLFADGVNNSGGWINSCNFYGGSMMGNSVPPAIDQMGVRMRRTAGSHSLYAHKFDGLQFDCGTSATNIRTGFYFDDAAGQEISWITGINCYCENLNSLAYFNGPNPNAHYFSVRKGHAGLSSGDLRILQPNAVAKTLSRVAATFHKADYDVTGTSFQLMHWMFGHTILFDGSSNNVTITVSDASGVGEVTVVNDGSGTLNFAASGSVQTGSAITTLAPGEIAKIRSYARGAKHKIWKV